MDVVVLLRRGGLGLALTSGLVHKSLVTRCEVSASR